MRNMIEFNEEIIEYTLRKSNRKTIGISIKPETGVNVTAPYRVSNDYVKSLVLEKGEWIQKKLKEVKASKPFIRDYAYGSAISILGKNCIIKINVNKELKKVYVKQSDYVLEISIPDKYNENEYTETVKKALAGWLKSLAGQIVIERIKYFSDRMGVSINRIFLKSQKTIWGSCSRKNNININWRIVMAPIEVIDYLVVHELAHIKVKNHSKAFWAEVESIIPEFRDRRKWLKDNGNMLCL